MEKGEGRTIGKTYAVDQYPTLLFIHPDNKELVHKAIGAQGKTDWLIGEARKALDPKRNLPGLAAAYQSDRHDAGGALAYLNALGVAGMSRQKDSLLTEYLCHLEDSERYSVKNWELVASQVKETESYAFRYLMEHADGFRMSVGEETVDDKIDDVYRMAVLPFIRRKRVAADQFPVQSFRALQKRLKGYDGKNASYYRAQVQMVDCVQQGDYAAMLRNLRHAEKSEPCIIRKPVLFSFGQI